MASVEAFYHLHVKNIGRRFGRSIVAAAAYRAGETLWNEAEERESVFVGRRDVVHAEIRLPDGAPAWMAERSTLWNAVEAAEKRKDARLAKEIEFSLPRELPREAWIGVARQMADAYRSQGFVVDVAVHEDGRGHNPHVHLLLATRRATPTGFGEKLRRADSPAFITEARQHWQQVANVALGKAGADAHIDARSYKDRGIERTPTTHRGPDRAARAYGRHMAAVIGGLLMLRSGDGEALREMLLEGDAHERFPDLVDHDAWPPISREQPDGLTPKQREQFDAYWAEVDRRKAEAAERTSPLEDARRETAAERAVAAIERLERRLDGIEPEIHPGLDAALRDDLDGLRTEVLALRSVEEEHIALQTREIERTRQAGRLLPVEGRDGTLVAAEPAGRGAGLSWSADFAGRRPTEREPEVRGPQLAVERPAADDRSPEGWSKSFAESQGVPPQGVAEDRESDERDPSDSRSDRDR